MGRMKKTDGRIGEMTEYELEDIFHESGHYHLYEQLKYKLWIAYQWLEADRNILSEFLNIYDFDHDEELYCKEFLFHYKIFKNIKKKNAFY